MDKLLEEEIAELIRVNKITIDSKTKYGIEVLCYIRNNGENLIIGETFYRYGIGPSHSLKYNKAEGYDDIVKCVEKLLTDTRGNFQDKRFDVIKKACREIESNNKFSPNWGEGN